MATENITTRLDPQQLDRMLAALRYWGLGTRTDVIKAALNHLENALQGLFSLNLMDAVSSVNHNNKRIKNIQKAIKELKRHAKTS